MIKITNKCLPQLFIKFSNQRFETVPASYEDILNTFSANLSIRLLIHMATLLGKTGLEAIMKPLNLFTSVCCAGNNLISMDFRKLV